MTTAATTRPPAPEDLLPEETDLWISIVNSRAADFFCPATLPLLSEFCRLRTQATLLAEKIEVFGDNSDQLNVEDGCKRYKLLTRIRDQGQGRMISLAQALRLTQQARYVPHSAAARPVRGAGERIANVRTRL